MTGNLNQLNNEYPYQLLNLTNEENYKNGIALYGVKFSNNKLMFWFKNNNGFIKQVTVVLDAKHENVQVQDGTVILSLKGLSSYQDLKTALIIFIKIMRERQPDSPEFHFIVDTQNQKDVVASLANDLGITCTIQTVAQKVEKVEYENVSQVQEKLNRNDKIIAFGSKNIEINDERGLKQFTLTADGSAVYENIGPLSIDELKKKLLEEWTKDPSRLDTIRDLSAQELDKLLTKTVTSNLTEYRMESAYDQTAVANDNKQAGQAAIDIASEKDGKVNAQTGITLDNTSNFNQYTIVEQNKGKINAVNPTVTSAQISSNNIPSSYANDNGAYGYSQFDITVTDEQSRDEILPVYFIDEDEFKLYDSYEDYLIQKESKITKQSCYPDLVNYTLNDATGRAIGRLANVKSIDRAPAPDTLTQSKVHTLRRVRKPEEPYRSAAFVNLSVIIFILSAFLILGAIILLLNI